MASRKNRRFLFSLTGIDIQKIDEKYGIEPVKTQLIDNPLEVYRERFNESQTGHITKIDDLEVVKRSPDIFSFLNEAKTLVKCTVSMIDFQSGKVVGKKGNFPYSCFWDRNPIPSGTTPIGCPIRYVPSKVRKSYHSEISKELYSILEGVTPKKEVVLLGTEVSKRGGASLLKKGNISLSTQNNNYYETDGIFCSFNCCMAYILSVEIHTNPLYRFSENLLMKMYNDFYDNNDRDSTPLEIIPAPHWRLLKEYGGTLTIGEFRETFNRICYVDHGLIFSGSGVLFEDQIKF